MKATAGLRTLSLANQSHLMDHAYSIMSSSGFKCQKTNVRVITGSEESLYAYVSLLVAFASLNKDDSNHVDEFRLDQLSVVDLGGSSKQLAFIIPKNISDSDKLFCDFHHVFQFPELIGYDSIYADSFIGKGLIAIMESIIEKYIQSNCLIGRMDELCAFDGNSYVLDDIVLTSHPCLSPSSPFPYTFLGRHVNLTGSGDFDKCINLIRDELLDLDQFRCIRSLLDNDFKKIIGMDNIPKILEMLHISSDTPFSPNSLADIGRITCLKPWEELLSEFPSHYPSYRAQRSCFGASYIYIIMTEIFGVDPNKYNQLLPLEEYGRFTLSWPLGAVVLGSLNY